MEVLTYLRRMSWAIDFPEAFYESTAVEVLTLTFFSTSTFLLVVKIVTFYFTVSFVAANVMLVTLAYDGAFLVSSVTCMNKWACWTDPIFNLAILSLVSFKRVAAFLAFFCFKSRRDWTWFFSSSLAFSSSWFSSISMRLISSYSFSNYFLASYIFSRWAVSSVDFSIGFIFCTTDICAYFFTFNILAFGAGDLGVAFLRSKVFGFWTTYFFYYYCYSLSY